MWARRALRPQLPVLTTCPHTPVQRCDPPVPSGPHLLIETGHLGIQGSSRAPSRPGVNRGDAVYATQPFDETPPPPPPHHITRPLVYFFRSWLSEEFLDLSLWCVSHPYCPASNAAAHAQRRDLAVVGQVQPPGLGHNVLDEVWVVALGLAQSRPQVRLLRQVLLPRDVVVPAPAPR